VAETDLGRAGQIAPLGPAVAASLIAGAALVLQWPQLPPGWVLWSALLVALLIWWRCRNPGRLAAALVIGMALCALHAASALALWWPLESKREDVLIEGQVVGLPVHEPARTQFVFKIADHADIPEPLRGQRVRLSWYDARGQDTDVRRLEVQPGSHWRLSARLRPPRGLRNPGVADAERQAMARRLASTGYVRSSEPLERLAEGQGIDHWRDTVAARIDTVVERKSARFVRALSIGDTRGLSDHDWEALRATGLTHLVAISGFHVGMVGAFFALLASGAWWLLPKLARRWPRPQAAAVIALLASIGYATAAGWELPTVRTVLMIAVLALARLLRRSSTVIQALAWAGIAVVVFDPMAVVFAGFWLSFAGVAWLAWCLPDVGRTSLVKGLLASQWVATLGLLPLTVILFGQASLAGPLANLVAIPWWSLVVVPLAILGTGLDALVSGSGDWAWRAAAWAFDLSWPLFEWLAGSVLSLWWLPEPRWFALPLALLAAFWMLLPRGIPGRALAALLWLPLLWPDRKLPAPGELDITVLDVGQGLSVLLRTARHSVLYDTGPAVPDGYDAGERVVVPSLHALGVRRLDAIIISHGDLDHVGGFEAVRRRFPAPVVFAPRHDRPNSDAAPCLAGSHWQMDGVRFSFVHPDLHFPALRDRNVSSCVLRVETDHGAVLLPGDISAVVERLLVHRAPESVRADVVLAAHHGSKHSSDPLFITATRARHALISAGHGNAFGHPHPDVVMRWEAFGTKVHGTPDTGALRIRIGADGVDVQGERQRRRRFWDAGRRSED